jgi:hypothetical protein
MRHQQEKVVEKGWDDEFEIYDEWTRFGPLPPCVHSEPTTGPPVAASS